MAGRIRDKDIQLVRERARIDEVIEPYVTLRNAGGGARKGLCPFHDEKTPSFNVRPSQGFYHCFGCEAGGDVITFLREIEGLSFVEAVEHLADQYHIQLHYEESSGGGERRDPAQRNRLIEAHRLAAEFYANALATSSEAAPARTFVTDRGFDQAAAEKFGMGYSPRAGQALCDYLRGRGFTNQELLAGGLAGDGARGLYDRFRGRVMWPIREINGDVIGFGARRLYDDDRIEAKYLNTSETPIYSKAKVLYGIDLARRPISSRSQAVVVEGYTDVMACHLAGVDTAVATCGTAFGADHARMLRRIMLDHDAFHGEVIFTFDGDEAGRRAAMKTYSGDQQFVAQTYVAVEKNGMDPCDLRQDHGDAAVRELVASRVPLYRFVLDNTISRYDLDRADQRVDAVREAVSLAPAIRDRSKVEAFLREVASMIGVDVDDVRREFRTAGRPAQQERSARPSTDGASASADQPDLGDARFAAEREALKAIVQFPYMAHAAVTELDDDDFTHPMTRLLWQHIQSGQLPSQPDSSWVPAIAESLPNDESRRILRVCAVDPLNATVAETQRAVTARIARLQEVTTTRRINDVKSRLQRTNPVDDDEEYRRMFGQLVELEQQRRELRQLAIGE